MTIVTAVLGACALGLLAYYAYLLMTGDDQG